MDEVVRGGEADGPREVGEDDGRVHLEDDDRVALHRRLDHPHDAPLLLPRRAARQAHSREAGGPLGLPLSADLTERVLFPKVTKQVSGYNSNKFRQDVSDSRSSQYPIAIPHHIVR